MVKYEDYGMNGLGVPLTRAYSDAGMYIEREGELFSKAIDPTNAGRTYTETDTPIEAEQEDEFVNELLAEVKNDD